MTRSRRTRNNAGRRQAAIMAGGGLLLLLALLYWGGTGQPGAAFWPGVAVAGGVGVGVGALTWWLLLSPLPAGERVAAHPNPAVRQATAYVVAAGGILFLVGALWDAAWRQMVGTAATGASLGWPPNLLLYGSVGLIAVTALGAALISARGAGSLRARWRNDPLLGLLGLLALFTLLVMAADLLWRGADATGAVAWDASQVLLGVGMAAVMLGTAAVQTSLLPQPAGWTIHRLGGGELNTVILLAVAAAILLLAGAGAWGHPPDDVLRPAWYFPAAILGVTLFIGQIGLHVLHRPGAAILIFAAVLFFRAITNFLFQQLFGMTSAGATAEFLALIPAAAMDVVYVYRTDEAGEMSTAWLAAGVGSAAMLAGGLWLLPRLVTYPPVDAGTLPGLLIAGAVVGLFGGWCGARSGRTMAGVRRVALPSGATQTRAAIFGAGAYIVLLAIAFYFIKSAPPPQ